MIKDKSSNHRFVRLVWFAAIFFHIVLPVWFAVKILDHYSSNENVCSNRTFPSRFTIVRS